jgi:hypothetical protein
LGLSKRKHETQDQRESIRKRSARLKAKSSLVVAEKKERRASQKLLEEAQKQVADSKQALRYRSAQFYRRRASVPQSQDDKKSAPRVLMNGSSKEYGRARYREMRSSETRD